MPPLPLLLLVSLPFAIGIACGRAGATNLPTGFRDTIVVGGFDFPVGMAFLPDGRTFVVEQKSGKVRLIVRGALAPVDPVATLPSIRTSGNEQGLLGIAVDPGWPAHPYIYIHCDDASAPVIRVSRYTVAGDLGFTGNGSLTVNPATRYDLFNDAPDVASNHNGGTVRFGVDGTLYVSIGDDASSASQDLTSLAGKILRLDVSRLPAGPGAAPRALVAAAGNPFAANPDSNARLLWSYGLRNPFRFHVDPAGGTLVVGDVGETHFEEMDVVPAGGHNFGWPTYEATTATGSACPGVIGDAPIYFYDRSAFTAAIVGGPVYRGPVSATQKFPAGYEGDVFLSDYYAGFLRRLHRVGSAWAIADPVAGQPNGTDWGNGFDAVSDYTVGPDGALWYCRQATNFANNTGEIRRVVYDPTAVPVDSIPESGVAFLPPWPRPAGASVHFAYLLPADSRTELVIFDITGRLVRRLLSPSIQPASRYDLLWDGNDERGRRIPGLYVARLTVDGLTHDQRVLLLR
jgi:glucose/arabinose dehydrogenase